MFRKKTIGFQLTAGFALVVALMAVIAVVDFIGLGAVQSNVEELHTKKLPAIDFLIEADRDLQQALVAERTLIALPVHDERREELFATVEENREQSVERLAKYRQLAGSVKEAEVYERYLSERKKWDSGHAKVMNLLRRQDDDARKEAAILSTGSVSEQFETMRNEIDTLEELVMELANEEANKAESSYMRVVIITGCVAALAIAMSLLLASFLSRGIARPVRRAAMMAERIANGDLVAEMTDSEKSDHTSLDMAMLNGAIVQLSTTLRTQVSAMKNAAAALLKESSQLASATAQLASGASEQASSISETTTTIEELKQTGKETSDNAKTIVSNAEKSVDVSQAGLKSVDQSIGDIRRIFDQVESTVSGIDQVRTRVAEVDEIIATVTKVADQSNLLAVNASIEAAKANEYGRGFAVVAQEVKNLAVQSSDATNKVRDTLSSIQEAIEEVVVLARSTRERAEAGVSSIEKSGAMINNLGDDITTYSSTAKQIAISANEHDMGLEQISQAMVAINKAAADNQANAAAVKRGGESLNKLAAELEALVSNYKTDTNSYQRV